MKVVEYKVYGSFIEIIFTNELECKVTVSIRDNGDNTLEEVDDGITFEEIEEVIATVRSGKIEIEIL